MAAVAHQLRRQSGCAFVLDRGRWASLITGSAEMGATQAAAEVQHPRAGRELNAAKHGILSRHAVLPWEDRAEFEALVTALVDEHEPVGATERHLVEVIAVVMWRQQRVLLAEAASHRAALHQRLEWGGLDLARRAVVPNGRGLFGDHPRAAVAATPGDLEAELDGLIADELAATAASDALRSGAPYGEAMDRLTDEIRDGWDEALLESSMARALAEERGLDLGDPERSHRPDRDSLLRFLEDDVLAWLRTRRRDIESRCQVRAQALGEALNVEQLDKLARYETHLDRKLARTLAMLLKLQEVRRTIAAPAA
jgi:hypothetical protein